MTSPTARLVRRAGLLLMLAAALAGFFLLISFLVAQISSGPSDLLAARPSEEKGIPMPNGAGLFTFAVAAIALILGIVALAAPRHWALRGGIPRPRRSLVVGALAAAVLVGAGLYLAFSGVLSQDIAYGEHQAQRKWVEPAGLLVLAGFFLSVAIVGIVNPRFLLAPLAVWLAVAIGFGFFDSPALAGLNLFERPSKLEEPAAYAAEVEKYRRREDPSAPMAAAVPWDVSLPLESGGVVLSRGDSEFVLVPGTSTGWNQSSVSNPLFEVTGAAHTSFLRSATGDVYENGEWTQLDPVEVTANPREAIPESVLGLIGDRLNEQIVPLQPHRLRRELLSRPLTPPDAVHVDQISVAPAGELDTFVPGVLPTSAVLLEVDAPGVYRPFSATFLAAEPVTGYRWDSWVAEFSESRLNQAGPADDATYLQLPEGLPSRARLLVLVREITHGLDSPYAKARAIEAHLVSEYAYSLPETGQQPVQPPAGSDPVDWFLFDSRVGGCGSFSTAFVVLARAAGVPARVVSGWAVGRYEGTQTVYGDQSHQWAEIALDSLGWVTFDLTPGGAPSRVVQ